MTGSGFVCSVPPFAGGFGAALGRFPLPLPWGCLRPQSPNPRPPAVSPNSGRFSPATGQQQRARPAAGTAGSGHSRSRAASAVAGEAAPGLGGRRLSLFGLRVRGLVWGRARAGQGRLRAAGSGEGQRGQDGQGCPGSPGGVRSSLAVAPQPPAGTGKEPSSVVPGREALGARLGSVPGSEVELGAGSWALPCGGASPEQGHPSRPAAVQSRCEETSQPGREHAGTSGHQHSTGSPAVPRPLASPARPEGGGALCGDTEETSRRINQSATAKCFSESALKIIKLN